MDISGGGLREPNIFGLFKIYGNVSSLDEAEIVCMIETDDNQEECLDRMELIKRICRDHLILTGRKTQEEGWKTCQFQVHCWDHSDFERELNVLKKSFQSVFTLQERLKAGTEQFLREGNQFETLMQFAPKRHQKQQDQIRSALKGNIEVVSSLMSAIHDKHIRQVRKLQTTYLSKQKDSLRQEIQAGIQSHGKVIVLVKQEYILNHLCSPVLSRINARTVQEDLFKKNKFVIISHMNDTPIPMAHMPKLWNGFLKREEKSDSDSDEEDKLAVTPAAIPKQESDLCLFDFDEA